MKVVVSSLLVLAFSLAVFSCQNEPITPSSGFATSWEVNADTFIAATSQTTGDPFFIKKAVLNDSLLKVTVQYAGGCKKHDFKLVWDGTIDSSTIPAVATFALIHDGNNDMCEALPTEELTFDLLDIMKGNRPAEGTKYYIGVKILDNYEPNPDVVVCQAYPGDHYSVEITCIQPYE
ncbi:MAG: hypothetical protein RIF36_07675 [Imperialibacter sp.]|uniref:hypothetical protein n=1 Tax=Imperialibacter sp. TaxID=2038411 RepID=UPI0032F00680